MQNRVDLNDGFLARFDFIKTFPADTDTSFAYGDLLAALPVTLLLIFDRFPLMGRR